MRYLLLYSIVFSLGLLLTTIDLQACNRLKRNIARLMGIVDIELNTKLTHLMQKDLKARKFEEKLAKKADLGLEETVALIRNFTHILTKDGSINVFRRGNNLVLKTDVNLIAAYKYGKANLVSGSITVDQIIAMRKKAIEVLARDKGREQVRPEFTFKDNESVAKVGNDIHPDTVKKLKEYNFEVTKVKDGYLIRYGAMENQVGLLHQYVEQLNELARSQAPPEMITAFAVQELLIRHPFEDGNGRTARLIGQIIYHQYTGKHIFFPKAFHYEMNYTLPELVDFLQ